MMIINELGMMNCMMIINELGMMNCMMIINELGMMWKKQEKFLLCLIVDHNGLRGSEGTAPRILNLGTRGGGRMVSFTLRPFYPMGKSPRDKRLGEPQGRSERNVNELVKIHRPYAIM
jgi:hypothetical protein